VAAARLGLVTLALVLTGCASMRASEQTRWQVLADEATSTTARRGSCSWAPTATPGGCSRTSWVTI
jgi:hypothetical protein